MVALISVKSGGNVERHVWNMDAYSGKTEVELFMRSWFVVARDIWHIIMGISASVLGVHAPGSKYIINFKKKKIDS